jgi:asparagine N-glycosylation enzyme membrane subunit Stt3
MRALFGFALAVFGALLILVTIVIGAPLFTGWTGVAGAFAIIAAVAVWGAR